MTENKEEYKHVTSIEQVKIWAAEVAGEYLDLDFDLDYDKPANVETMAVLLYDWATREDDEPGQS